MTNRQREMTDDEIRLYNYKGVQGCLFQSMEYLLEGLDHPKYWDKEDNEELLETLFKVNQLSSKFLAKRLHR